MKALILAAGLGTRLRPLTDNRPKSLVPVNGKPILLKQIENLHKNQIYDITIVGGYRFDVLQKNIQDLYPEIHLIESPNYAETNNMFSAYLGHERMAGSSFLMMNADVFYDDSVVESLLAFDAPNAIVCDIGRYLPESMKIEVGDEGNIVNIAKDIPLEKAYGSTIDVYKVSNIGGAAFFEKCREIIEDQHEKKLWNEVALQAIFPEVIFKPCPLVGRWLEIDNHEDLAEAELLFKDEH